MTDSQIIDLYLSRSEEALQATLERYGSYCFSISLGILKNRHPDGLSDCQHHLTFPNA